MYVVKMLFTVESSDGDVVSVVGRGAESRAEANPRVSFFSISRPFRSTMSRDRVFDLRTSTLLMVELADCLSDFPYTFWPFGYCLTWLFSSFKQYSYFASAATILPPAL